MRDLTGTWHLHSWHSLKNDLRDGYPMGDDAKGQIIYAADGCMCAFLMRADFDASDGPATADTCLAYGGSWSVDGDMITHQVRFASLPHWIGRPLVRQMIRTGDGLTLRTEPERSRSGNTYVHELIWRRTEPA